MARYRNVRRIFHVGNDVLVGVSGDAADMQELRRELEGLAYVALSCTMARTMSSIVLVVT